MSHEHEHERIWYDDITKFYTYNNYYVILPMQTMTIEEKLNAIVRFFIYLGIFLALIKSDYRYLFFGMIAALVSVLLYQYEEKQKAKTEKFLEENKIAIVENKVCTRSTVDNPFMNPSIADIVFDPDHPVACNIENEKIKDDIQKNFDKRMFKDVSDIYNNQASQRQFYTMPVTTIPGDQTEFAKWCYGTPPSCKEGNGSQCYRNLYVVRPS